MKYLVTLALTMSFTIFADDLKPAADVSAEKPAANKTLTKEQVEKIEARRAERRAAGFVTIKGEGKAVVFYDMRSDKSIDISSELTKMEQFFGISLETIPAEKTESECTMKFAMKSVTEGKCSAAIVLANCGDNPTRRPSRRRGEGRGGVGG